MLLKPVNSALKICRVYAAGRRQHGKALEASANEKGPFKEGLEITYRQLLSALEHNGMKCENPVGLKFDPNTMQAITMVKDPAVQPGCVATVFQRGWKIADRVLRPAMVAVAQ